MQDLHYIDDYACMLGTGCLDVQTHAHIHTWMFLPAIYSAQDHIQNESTYIMYHAICRSVYLILYVYYSVSMINYIVTSIL